MATLNLLPCMRISNDLYSRPMGLMMGPQQHTPHDCLSPYYTVVAIVPDVAILTAGHDHVHVSKQTLLSACAAGPSIITPPKHCSVWLAW